MALHEDSRYTTDTLIVEVVNEYTGIATRPAYIDLRFRQTETAADDRTFAPDDSQEWANMGRKLLGDANAWWIIADLSGIVDPFEELEQFNTVGSKKRMLVVPSKNRFHLEILSGEVRQR